MGGLSHELVAIAVGARDAPARGLSWVIGGCVVLVPAGVASYRLLALRFDKGPSDT
jgi:hypothetical protein